MSEQSRERGPKMLVATEALRAPKLRIGKITNNVVLPRTVPAAALISGLVSSLVFMVLFCTFAGWSTQTVMYSMTFGGAFGVFVVSYSPMRGESLAKWLGLKVRSRRGRARLVRGRPVRLAVGICYVEPKFEGMVRARTGAIPVRAGSFDERGVRVRETVWRAPKANTDQLTLAQVEAELELRTSRPGSGLSALGRYREITNQRELPDTYRPSSTASAKKRWAQDAEELRGLYQAPAAPRQDLLDPSEADVSVVSDVLDTSQDATPPVGQ
jgi:hypothetical protein